MVRFCFVLTLVLPLAGCSSKVRLETTVPVAPGEAKRQIFDPPKQDQRIRVEFESAQPVSVAAALSADVDAMTDAVIEGKEPKGALGHVAKQKSGSFEITVPKGQEFEVLIGVPLGGKQAEVTLKVNSL